MVGSLPFLSSTVRAHCEPRRILYGVQARHHHLEAQARRAAQRKAEEEAHNLIKEARENRENILKTTELEVTKIKNDAKEELGREVKNLAAELAEKIIKEKVDDAQEISLIDKFIAEVGEDK